MMNLDKLVSKSEPLRKINARFVKVVAYKAGRDKKGFATAMAKTYTSQEVNVHKKVVTSKDQNRYVSSFKFLDKKLHVECSCSCPDFMYRFEFNLARVGAARIIYGNGEEPTMYHEIGLCKHLIALRAIIKKKHNI